MSIPRPASCGRTRALAVAALIGVARAGGARPPSPGGGLAPAASARRRHAAHAPRAADGDHHRAAGGRAAGRWPRPSPSSRAPSCRRRARRRRRCSRSWTRPTCRPRTRTARRWRRRRSDRCVASGSSSSSREDGTVEIARDARGVAVSREVVDAMASMPAVFPRRSVTHRRALAARDAARLVQSARRRGRALTCGPSSDSTRSHATASWRTSRCAATSCPTTTGRRRAVGAHDGRDAGGPPARMDDGLAVHARHHARSSRRPQAPPPRRCDS